MNPNPVTRAIILGGGPAGLSAASELARQGYTPLIPLRYRRTPLLHQVVYGVTRYEP